MLKDIVEARATGGYTIYIRFEDGIDGEIDLSKLVEFKGVFGPLQDVREVARVKVDPELGTICWPNGADLDPDVLYSLVTGQALPSYAEAAKPERAIELYQCFTAICRSKGFPVATGVFQAHMEVRLVNDGPVTILYDSEK